MVDERIRIVLAIRTTLKSGWSATDLAVAGDTSRLVGRERVLRFDEGDVSLGGIELNQLLLQQIGCSDCWG